MVWYGMVWCGILGDPNPAFLFFPFSFSFSFLFLFLWDIFFVKLEFFFVKLQDGSFFLFFS